MGGFQGCSFPFGGRAAGLPRRDIRTDATPMQLTTLISHLPSVTGLSPIPLLVPPKTGSHLIVPDRSELRYDIHVMQYPFRLFLLHYLFISQALHISANSAKQKGVLILRKWHRVTCKRIHSRPCIPHSLGVMTTCLCVQVVHLCGVAYICRV